GVGEGERLARGGAGTHVDRTLSLVGSARGGAAEEGLRSGARSTFHAPICRISRELADREIDVVRSAFLKPALRLSRRRGDRRPSDRLHARDGAAALCSAPRRAGSAGESGSRAAAAAGLVPRLPERSHCAPPRGWSAAPVRIAPPCTEAMARRPTSPHHAPLPSSR